MRKPDQAANESTPPRAANRGPGNLIPALGWMRGYQRQNLGGDLSAGLTTAVMLIPQGMAYAMLAGLPPIMGLYASVIPLILYALLGTSRQLAVGPVAIVSLMVAAGVGGIAEQGTAEYISYAILLALMVGAIQVIMGVAKAGFLVNFLSHPVVSGFTSAAAIVIGLSQLKHLLGVDLASSMNVAALLSEAVERVGETHLPTLAIGLAGIVLMVALRRWKPVFPGALTVVLLSTLAVWALGLEDRNVAVVGSVPAGLPGLLLPAWDGNVLLQLLPTALAIALIGFMESIAVAKSFARRYRYDIEPDKELIALGTANLGGGLFQSFPVTGGFSRTAVNAQAGARTGLASLVTAGVVALTLIMLTPLFYYLPRAILAAIVMVAVTGLIDIKEVRHLWKVKRSDLALLVLTFAATLGLGIEVGILTGIGASLLWFVVQTTRPHYAILGRLPGTTTYRNLKRYPEARTFPGVLILRMDAQFYFGNVSFLKETLRRLEQQSEAPLRGVILDAASIASLDSSAETALEEIAESYTARGVQLLLAGVKGPVLDVMRQAGFYDRFGPQHFFFDVEAAVRSLNGDQGSFGDHGDGI